MISAMTSDHVIGNQGALPRHYPQDLQHFKQITLGHPIVMGRKTFESIGRPLPQRRNIVLTRNHQRKSDGIEVVYDRDTILHASQDETYFIIGGQQIYELFLQYADILHITLIKKNVPGDTYFPPFEKSFTETNREVYDEFDFITYEKISGNNT